MTLVARHPRLKHRVRSMYYRLNGRPVAGGATEAATVERLRGIYAPANASLADLLGRFGYTDLPPWLSATRRASSDQGGRPRV